MRIPFGKWLPDLAPLKNQGTLGVCKNVLPVANGYAPAPQLEETDSFKLPARPRGSLRGQLDDGTNFFFAGALTQLFRLLESTGWTDVSRAAGYTSIGDNRWAMRQFDTFVFAAARANPTQVFDLNADSTFSDLEGAPRAAVCEVAESFLWLGDIFSTDAGVQRNAVQWSAVGDPTYWPVPGTDAATSVLSGRQELEGNGGFVTAIVSGAEVVAIFQERAVWRADFVGNDIVWQFNRMENEHGCVVPQAAVSFERKVLYLSDDGWRVFNYTSTQNIGKDTINDWFFEDWDGNYPDSVSMAKDPQQTRIYISYASKDASGTGIPDRTLIWDYGLDQWTILYPGNHFELIQGGGIARSLDSPDVDLGIGVEGDDPDIIGRTNAGGDPNQLDTVDPGDQSFDDRQLDGSRVVIGAFGLDFGLSTFTGPGLPGELETGDLELAEERHSLLTWIRPLVDGEETSVQVAGLNQRAQYTKHIDFGTVIRMNPNGECNMRVNARYHRIRFLLSPYFTEATDFELKASRKGSR